MSYPPLSCIFHTISSFSDRFSSPPTGSGVHASLPLTKSVDAVFSLSNTEGSFEGYASLFGIMDLGRDVVMPGAFRDTIEKRGAGGVRLLWQHDPAQPLGRWTSIIEDGQGLYVRGQLDLEQPKSRQVLSLMQNGALDGLSIGYRTESEKRDPATGMRRLERIDLWEISLVTFPLLPQARVKPLAKVSRRSQAAFFR